MMLLSVLDHLGNWNPQLFRELKGRLILRNTAIAIGLSLLGQLLLLMYFSTQLPSLEKQEQKFLYYRNRYCTGGDWSSYDGASCFILGGHPVANWQLWWTDVFFMFAWIASIILLTAGTYMLVSDLDREERRGTLNFLRLSPQSATSILLGKLLGVPCLLYLGIALGTPLYFWAGLNAKISLPFMLGFAGLLVVASIFIYSSALLFGLASSWMKGVQPWLASGLVLMLSWLFAAKSIDRDGTDLINFFQPSTILPYLAPETYLKGGQIFGTNAEYLLRELKQWQWFELPIGASFAVVLSFMLLNYGLWTGLIWQSLQRRFRNQNAPLVSKKSSYLITLYFTSLSLGFAYQQKYLEFEDRHYSINLCWNLLLFSILFFALSPQLQTLLDWSRYRQERYKAKAKYSLIPDLIWGEKSPATLAIVLNVLIVACLFVPAISLSTLNPLAQTRFLSGVFLNLSFILLCASIIQLILFVKAPKQAIWALVALGTLILAPLVIFAIFSIDPGDRLASLWLLSGFAWNVASHASLTRVFQALLIHLTVFSLCTWQFSRRLQKAGESQSKALLTAQRR